MVSMGMTRSTSSKSSVFIFKYRNGYDDKIENMIMLVIMGSFAITLFYRNHFDEDEQSF